MLVGFGLGVLGERYILQITEPLGAPALVVGSQGQVLYALLAGTGLRVGEALGLEVSHVSADRRTITIERSRWAGKLHSPKTKNAYGQVDLCSALAELLKVFLADRNF